MSSPKTYIFVCDSHKANIHGGGCCNDKQASALIASFQAQIEAADLQQEIEVRASACLRNCPNGISVKTFPGGVLYSKVSSGDIPNILNTLIKVNRNQP